MFKIYFTTFILVCIGIHLMLVTRADDDMMPENPDYSFLFTGSTEEYLLDIKKQTLSMATCKIP